MGVRHMAVAIVDRSPIPSMTVDVRPFPAHDTDDCGQKPEGIRAAFVGQCSTLHLGRQTFGLSRDRLGSTEQRLFVRFRALTVGMVVVPFGRFGVERCRKPHGHTLSSATTVKTILTPSHEMQDDDRQWRKTDLYTGRAIQPNRRDDAPQHDNLPGAQPTKRCDLVGCCKPCQCGHWMAQEIAAHTYAALLPIHKQAAS